jgi:hypothetical protein
MIENAEPIPRRTILKWGLGLGAAAATASASVYYSNIGEFVDSNFIQPESSRLDYLLDYEKTFINPLDTEFTGAIINAPFPAYDLRPDTPERFREKMNLLNSNTARIFIKDGLEGTLGEYNDFYIERIKTFIENVNNTDENEFTFCIPFIDMFRFEHSNRFNPVYGSLPLKHGYLKGAKTPEEIERSHLEFFSDPQTIDIYKHIIQYIMNYLKPVSQYITWEIANEPAILFNTEDKNGALTEWLATILPVITDNDPGKLISAGTADATSYNGRELVKLGLNTASFHTYLSDGQDMIHMQQYAAEMIQDPTLPGIFWSEMGAARKFLGIHIPRQVHDWSLEHTIVDMFFMNTHINDDEKKLILPCSNIGIWNLDLDENHDGFDFDPSSYPRTTHAIHTIQTLLKTT